MPWFRGHALLHTHTAVKNTLITLLDKLRLCSACCCWAMAWQSAVVFPNVCTPRVIV